MPCWSQQLERVSEPKARAWQGRAGQGRAGQGRAGQKGQGRTGLGFRGLGFRGLGVGSLGWVFFGPGLREFTHCISRSLDPRIVVYFLNLGSQNPEVSMEALRGSMTSGNIMHTCTHTYIHIRVYIYIHIRMYIYIYTHTHKHERIFADN